MERLFWQLGCALVAVAVVERSGGCCIETKNKREFMDCPPVRKKMSVVDIERWPLQGGGRQWRFNYMNNHYQSTTTDLKS